MESSERKETSRQQGLTEQNDTNRESKTTQYYNCVYCMRGFTTAQALGGHMNIHRKDRAKTQISTSSPLDARVYRPPELSLFCEKGSSNEGVLTPDVQWTTNSKKEEREELDLVLRLGHES
ncbi:hypothetical protein LUZ60_006908 [Juncus effusus]|nr:hypothetical protein LUZ60_006908 [Juncus effusus]